MVLHKPDVHEIQQHLLTAENLLADAKKPTNSLETRFNIGNSAGHHLLQAAVKINGYRPAAEKGHRSILYKLLDDLVPGAAGAKETLARAHNARNKAEYDGDAFDVTQGLVDDLVSGVDSVKEELDFMFKQFKKSNAPPADGTNN